MYQNILIPVSLDEDRDIDTAINAAKALASPGARMTFVNVLETIPAYVADAIPPETFTERRSAVENRLNSVSEGVENSNTVILDGTAGRTLTDWAKKNGADLIVIASHRPAFSDIFLGSTAAWVVRHADCAVHVIR